MEGGARDIPLAGVGVGLARVRACVSDNATGIRPIDLERSGPM
jgi:hypothetical protein